MAKNRAGLFASLIPELKDWNHGDGIEIDAWIQCVGSFELAIGYAELFWPSLILHDDCVFIGRDFTKSDETRYKGFLDATNGDKTRVEITMNHRHILDLFAEGDPTEQQVIYIGRKLREMWQAKANRDFPNRDIIASFPEEKVNDLLDYEVTLFQRRDKQV